MITFDETEWEQVKTGNDEIVLKRKVVALKWPEKEALFYFANEESGVSTAYYNAQPAPIDYNFYLTPEDAAYAARQINILHAIIRACRQVEVFEPDWGNERQKKWHVRFDNKANKWYVDFTCTRSASAPCFFSAIGYAEQAAAILNTLNLYGEKDK